MAALCQPVGAPAGRRRAGGSLGEAVQVNPIKLTVKALGAKRLTLKYDELASSFAFNFNLRLYTSAPATETAAQKRSIRGGSNGGNGGKGGRGGNGVGGGGGGGGSKTPGTGPWGALGRRGSCSLSIDSAMSDSPCPEDGDDGGGGGGGDGGGSGSEGGGGSEDRQHAVVLYDAFMNEVLHLCQTLQLRVVPAQQPSAEETEEEEGARNGRAWQLLPATSRHRLTHFHGLPRHLTHF